MDVFKKCLKCKGDINVDLFAWKNEAKQIRQRWCKNCARKYAIQHYLLNKQRYVDRAIKQNSTARIENKKWLKELYGKEWKCSHCPENNDICLDFHHVDEQEKDYNLSQILGRSKKVIQREIKKCIILCSNCHRKEHHRLRGIGEM